jgi:hypothetical protein
MEAGEEVAVEMMADDEGYSAPALYGQNRATVPAESASPEAKPSRTLTLPTSSGGNNSKRASALGPAPIQRVRTVFDEAQREVVNLMEKDSWSRFIRR